MEEFLGDRQLGPLLEWERLLEAITKCSVFIVLSLSSSSLTGISSKASSYIRWLYFSMALEVLVNLFSAFDFGLEVALLILSSVVIYLNFLSCYTSS